MILAYNIIDKDFGFTIVYNLVGAVADHQNSHTLFPQIAAIWCRLQQKVAFESLYHLRALLLQLIVHFLNWWARGNA